MPDLLGPASAANTVTVRPADTRVFGATDTWAQDATSSTANNGTQWSAACFNGLLAQIRNLIRGCNVAVNNTNDNMMLQAVQSMAPPFAVDTGETPGQLVVNVNQPGFSLQAGTLIRVQIANTVPGPTTITLTNSAGPTTSFGTLNVTRPDTSALNTYDLVQRQIANLIFDGAEFQIKPYVPENTGHVSWELLGVSRTGYVPLNGLTIGSASSGATTLAGPLAQSLYTYLWNGMDNTLCPVSGGRGASAAADFAANKTLQLPDWQGKTSVGVDAMAGASATNRLAGVPVTAGAATTPGSTLGEALHGLLPAELPSTEFAVDIPAGQGSHTHGPNAGIGFAEQTGGSGAQGLATNTGAGTVDGGIAAATLPGMSGTAASGGSSAAHDNTQLSVTAVAFVRL